jgi:type IV pilus assembly protein PilA
MLQKLKKRIKNQRGMTLVELLAVIVILGIISAIAIPSIGKVIENSKRDAIRADAIQVLNAAKLYAAENGTLDTSENPLSLTDLSDYIDNVTTSTTYEITFDNNTPKISGTGTKGKTSIIFESATITGIDSAKKDDTTISK